MRIDLTPAFEAVIALLVALITSKLIPYIKSKVSEQQFDNLTAAAKVAVYAAEQIWGTGENQKKLEYAIRHVKLAGFDLNEGTIQTAIENAVYELKTERKITDAYKEKALKPEETAADTEVELDYSIPLVKDWPLEMIIQFCQDNNIPHDTCTSKEDYVRAITKDSRKQPPDTEEVSAGD